MDNSDTILPACLLQPSKAPEKLGELGFDPIAKLVATHEKIDREIYDMMYDDEGNPRRKFSQVAIAALYGIQAKIGADLLKYGYKRVPETIEVAPVAPKPITITLTHGAPQIVPAEQ